MIIVVAGIPGSGKTTLAHQLGAALELTVISKDEIKEALFDVLGSGDAAYARRLGGAAHQAMYAIARHSPADLILEAHFERGRAETDLGSLGHELVQIYCRCPIDLAWERYRRRRDDPDRHPGHRPEHQDEAATATWRTTEPRPLDLDALLIEIDTSQPIDVNRLATELRRQGPTQT